MVELSLADAVNEPGLGIVEAGVEEEGAGLFGFALLEPKEREVIGGDAAIHIGGAAGADFLEEEFGFIFAAQFEKNGAARAFQGEGRRDGFAVECCPGIGGQEQFQATVNQGVSGRGIERENGFIRLGRRHKAVGK